MVETRLPIAVDVMGADNGSLDIVLGALQAVDELGVAVSLVGDEAEIKSALAIFKKSFVASKRSGGGKLTTIQSPESKSPESKSIVHESPEQVFHRWIESQVTIHHASQVITMDDSPTKAIRRKPDASICVAFDLVRQGKASAVVSPGNTGAMMAAGLMACGTIPGIARPAIASLIPTVDSSPTVLLDSGANTDSSASQLVQFALMGHFYAKAVLGIESPRVALLSNGTEASKGNDRIRAAAQMLRGVPLIHFSGYVEGRDVGTDKADVVVCDGFVGNIVLKTMEGAVELALNCMRQYVQKSFRSKIGMWLAKPMFKALFREKLDKSAYGGAPLLGLNQIGIVCHGSSDVRAIKNAVRVADMLVKQGTIAELANALSSLDAGTGEFVIES
jgi:phosphate acyltransferase